MSARRFVVTALVVGLAPFVPGCGGGEGGGGAESASGGGRPAGIAAPAPRVEKTIRFTDATASTGLDLVTTCGGTPSREILEVDGGGLVLFDYDRDGDLDLFVANGATMDAPEAGPGSRLFRNDTMAGGERGPVRFVDVTEEVGLDLRRWAMGATAGDFDGDGLDDLYVCCFGRNVLLRNVQTELGRTHFQDVTEAAGVGDERWSTSAAFGDLDRDGDLDLYVVNYIVFDPANPPPRSKHKGVTVMNGPHGLVAEHDVVYENLGGGRFRDVTEAAGCIPARAAFGLNLVIVDIDADGLQDVLVGNDSMANFHFRNTTPPSAARTGANTARDAPIRMRFEEVGLATGVASNFDGSNQATMGMTIGDVDGNGLPDLFSTNFANDTNTLHLNLDGRFFDDRTRQYGLGLLSRPYLGWGCGFYDFDHDGDEDLVAFNGHVYPEATIESMDSPYEQTPLLFVRESRRFQRATADVAGAWLDEAHRDRAAAFGDLDLDGDVDIVVSELNGPVRVLVSEAADEADDWLLVSLWDGRDASRNRAGLGARLDLTVGDRTMRRWISTGGGFQSSSQHAAHFGRPTGGEGRATLLVTWPDGQEQVVDDIAWGRRLVVSRPGP